MNRGLMVLAVTAALGALFLFGLLRGQPDRDIASARLNKRLPSFELPVHARYRTEYGSTFDFDSETLQRPLVVNFWATWCIPCRDEAPVLQGAWRRYGDRLTILGIQTQDPGRVAGGLEFIEEFDLTFPNLIDDRSRVSVEWGLFGVPETYFLRADGTLAYKHTGIVTDAVMNERIGELLQ